MLFAFGEIEAVKTFKYLGSLLHYDNDTNIEVLARVAAGSRCAWSLNRLLTSRSVSRRTKLQAYASIIRPIVTYGGETWSLTQEMERRLLVFENSLLRKIFGPVFDQDQQEWRRRHNDELRQLSDMPPITSVVRSMRLRWAGHLVRMPDEEPVKQVFLGRPEGRRPPGRPRRRWEDVLRSDLSSTGLRNVRRWMDVAADRQW